MNITRRSPLQPRPISCSGMYSRAPENICIELALRRTWGKPWGKEINIWCYGLHKTWIKVHKMFGVLKVINEPVGTSVFLWRNRSSLEKATLATWLQTNRCLNGYVAALFFCSKSFIRSLCAQSTWHSLRFSEWHKTQSKMTRITPLILEHLDLFFSHSSLLVSFFRGGST